MATPEGRRPIHAFLELETSDAFRALCRRQGCTQTSAVQALVAATVEASGGEGAGAVYLADVWDAARDIAADRRDRSS